MADSREELRHPHDVARLLVAALRLPCDGDSWLAIHINDLTLEKMVGEALLLFPEWARRHLHVVDGLCVGLPEVLYWARIGELVGPSHNGFTKILISRFIAKVLCYRLGVREEDVFAIGRKMYETSQGRWRNIMDEGSKWSFEEVRDRLEKKAEGPPAAADPDPKVAPVGGDPANPPSQPVGPPWSEVVPLVARSSNSEVESEDWEEGTVEVSVVGSDVVLSTVSPAGNHQLRMNLPNGRELAANLLYAIIEVQSRLRKAQEDTHGGQQGEV